VSRPDRAFDVAVDFSAPRRAGRTRPLVGLVIIMLALGAVTVAVTQLLLH